MLIKIFVDDTDYDLNDGYTLISDSPYAAANAIEIALKNGFKNIRISEANPEEKLKYNKVNQIEIGGVTL